MRIPPCGNYGDIDSDGYVTREDAVLVAGNARGTEPFTTDQTRRADVDGIPGVTMGDATVLGRYVEGAEGWGTFRVCEDMEERARATFLTIIIGLVILYILTR